MDVLSAYRTYITVTKDLQINAVLFTAPRAPTFMAPWALALALTPLSPSLTYRQVPRS